MTLVLDGLVTLAWCLPDQRSKATENVRRLVATEGAVVPVLWRLEVANGLLMAVRRRRLTETLALALLGEVDNMAIPVDPDGGSAVWARGWQLAATHRLTAYDASYLELALRRRLPLATLDAALARAATAEGTAVLP